MRDRGRRRLRGEDRLPYWSITFSSLDYTTLCYLQSLKFSLPMRPIQPVLTRRPWFSICRLDLPLQVETDSRLWPLISHVGICLYAFITPTHFQSTTWLFLLLFTGASFAKNLWFNMQHEFTPYVELPSLSQTRQDQVTGEVMMKYRKLPNEHWTRKHSHPPCRR